MTTEGKVHNLSKLSEGKLNVITYLCLGNIITENSKIINKTIMKRNVIHLNEGQLRRVIKESIEKILAENEENESNFYSDDNFENTMAHLAQRGVDKRSRRTRDDTARRATNFFGANKYGGRLPINHAAHPTRTSLYLTIPRLRVNIVSKRSFSVAFLVFQRKHASST